ncbi:ABC transporter permease [Cellulomonas carbonis]|uniref:ABC transporter permease n=1 Tax=Cellulomonas carbonis T26 TaxID=947969 RepID=A0A0A0BRF4_9CELL|nr:ABC transporter permease [Cellulomonas carbonis T26]GGC08765.1 ABC transporter permease [Cellulomonas carbonis]
MATDAALRRIPLLLVAAVAPAIWGTTYLVTTTWLPDDRPALAALCRALPAGLLLLAIGRRLPHGSWWWRSLVLGALNIAAFLTLLFVAAYRLPGGVAATLGAVQPLLVAGLAVVLLGDRLRTRTLVAGLLGVAGVALLVLRAGARMDGVGVAAGLGAAVVAALGVVLMRRWGRPVGLVPFTAWQLTAGGVLLVPVVVAVEGLPPALTPVEVGGLAHMALIGTALPYLLWFRGMQHLPVTDVSFLGLVSPVVATALGWAVLGQALGPWQLTGAAMTLTGLVLAQLTTGGRRVVADPSGPTTTSPRQWNQAPPLTSSTVPVEKEPAGDARNSTASATSSGVPARPSGVPATAAR